MIESDKYQERGKMKRNLSVCLVFEFLSVAFCFGTITTEIKYTSQDLGAGRWQYVYDVKNICLLVNSQPAAIKEFTIWFDYSLYRNLTITTPSPLAGLWDEIVWQPEPLLCDDGAYDALVKSPNPGISAGQTVRGFSVAFDWLGTGVPGKQYYEIVLPETSPLEVIDSGWTVPDPATALLLAIGGLLLRREKQ